MSSEQKKTISIVVPFLNERENLPLLYERLVRVFEQQPEDWELILVDDGSTDGSARWGADTAGADPRVKLLRLSRNFGHQIAITAGMDVSSGDAVVIMDADLQDPPEVVAELLAAWREGGDVVYAVRKHREGETWLKKTLAAGFYRVFHNLAKIQVPMNTGDFRLVDRKVVAALREVRELHRFMRGLTCWVGFRQKAVLYDRAARNAGVTKYPVWKSLNLAWDALTSFSGRPLRWITGMGVLVSVLGLLMAVVLVVDRYLHPDRFEKGWASLAAIILVLGGLQLISIGLVGQYVSRIFEESKKRPLYFVQERIGRFNTHND
ncbi:MAG: glycosyltransferase family 2 protein [Lentisphaerae bacterium]|nr:glycosyltransferase family 2 protein [Lentisphaerota bacterium]